MFVIDENVASGFVLASARGSRSFLSIRAANLSSYSRSFRRAAETSTRAACAPQIRAQEILCGLGFSLYIRVLRIRCVRGSRTERFFLSPKT
ncbi:MAG: hypothetical protein DMF47_08610 [Verrucomicrobia bacterium]|nr:MAG: hypothetical protein DMF47_08610 [Verrucomicrobiota bacterium]PYL87745.1 MAG: hypothetical protein DMF17_01680 [Verrucomicrobiota bacterium]